MPASGWRKSTVKNTLPGITLPRVRATPASCPRWRRLRRLLMPMRLTAWTICATPTSASLRRCIGVGPAWASWPVTVISYQRMPCTPLTTPMILSSASRIGPCSIWASKNARRPRARRSPGRRHSRCASVPRRWSCHRRPCATGRSRGRTRRRRRPRRSWPARSASLPRWSRPPPRSARGLVVEVVQRAQHLEPGHHAVIAVELAARRLGVDMAAGHDRRQRVVLARAAARRCCPSCRR